MSEKITNTYKHKFKHATVPFHIHFISHLKTEKHTLPFSLSSSLTITQITSGHHHHQRNPQLHRDPSLNPFTEENPPSKPNRKSPLRKTHDHIATAMSHHDHQEGFSCFEIFCRRRNHPTCRRNYTPCRRNQFSHRRNL